MPPPPPPLPTVDGLTAARDACLAERDDATRALGEMESAKNALEAEKNALEAEKVACEAELDTCAEQRRAYAINLSHMNKMLEDAVADAEKTAWIVRDERDRLSDLLEEETRLRVAATGELEALKIALEESIVAANAEVDARSERGGLVVGRRARAPGAAERGTGPAAAESEIEREREVFGAALAAAKEAASAVVDEISSVMRSIFLLEEEKITLEAANDALMGEKKGLEAERDELERRALACLQREEDELSAAAADTSGACEAERDALEAERDALSAAAAEATRALGEMEAAKNALEAERDELSAAAAEATGALGEMEAAKRKLEADFQCANKNKKCRKVFKRCGKGK